MLNTLHIGWFFFVSINETVHERYDGFATTIVVCNSIKGIFKGRYWKLSNVRRICNYHLNSTATESTKMGMTAVQISAHFKSGRMIYVSQMLRKKHSSLSSCTENSEVYNKLSHSGSTWCSPPKNSIDKLDSWYDNAFVFCLITSRIDDKSEYFNFNVRVRSKRTLTIRETRWTAGGLESPVFNLKHSTTSWIIVWRKWPREVTVINSLHILIKFTIQYKKLNKNDNQSMKLSTKDSIDETTALPTFVNA